jgi:hypothetical protein
MVVLPELSFKGERSRQSGAINAGKTLKLPESGTLYVLTLTDACERVLL